MRILRVGDPHAKVSNLAEMELLLQFIYDTAVKLNVQRIEILGDLFHTHAVLRLEVLDLWDRWLAKLSESFEVVVLVGNHDQSGDYKSDLHALKVFKRGANQNLHIIDTPRRFGPIGYLPYVHDNKLFTEYCQSLSNDGAKTLVSHTTYQGSKFESGIYAPDGVDPEQLPFDLLISGHIHSRQRFVTGRGQRVIYPGTSRWDTGSDANEPKGLWLCDHDPVSGSLVAEDFIDTGMIVTPIVAVDWKEGDPMPLWVERARAHVQLIGSSSFVAQAKAALKGTCSISTKITDRARPANRVAQPSLDKFLENCTLSSGVDRDKLTKFMRDNKIV